MHISIYNSIISWLGGSRIPFVRLSLLCCLSGLLSSCAQQGFPGGGPKDVAPPVQQTAIPPTGSTHFHGNDFFIGFDEYVVLKEADNNVVVSPPLLHKLQYSTKGHGLQVSWRDTLQPNTTYHFCFLNAVADFNEGNVLRRMEYVFSTGAVLDSCSLGGRVCDALSGTAWKEPVTVALYRATTVQGLQRYETTANDSTFACYSVGGVADSLLLDSLPAYVARCDSSGLFRFAYLHPDNYRLVAFVDGNRNLRLDKNEAVAFLDTVVSSEYIAPLLPCDTSLTDSLQQRCDSLNRQEALCLQRWQLRMFLPELTRQRLNTPSMPHKGYGELPATLPLQRPTLVSLADSMVWTLNHTHDTVRVWSCGHATDSLWLVLDDPTGLHDTVKLRYRAPRTNKTSGNRPGSAGRSTAAGNTMPAVRFSAKAKFDYYDTLRLCFATPSRQHGDSTVIPVFIYNLRDSSETIAFARIGDTMGLQAWVVDSAGLPFRFVAGGKYHCLLCPGHFTDLYGNSNDTVVCSFEVTSENQYANLQVAFSVEDTCPFLLQLLDGQGNVIQQQTLDEGDAHFLHLAPGRYSLRAIEDNNGNGRWDTGDLWQHRQPERTFTFPKSMELRANWNINEMWHIDNRR